MELNEYQKKAMQTCTSSSNNYSYMSSNLVGEVGEFIGAVGKLVRKNKACIINNELKFTDSSIEDDTLNLKKEAGDILWQLSGLCEVLGWSLEEVAQMNLDKLADRQERNVIVGNGDNR